MKDPGARTQTSVKNVENVMEMNKLKYFMMKNGYQLFHRLATSCSLIVRKNKIALEKKSERATRGQFCFEIMQIQDTCDACDEFEEINRDVSPAHLLILKRLFCVSVLHITKDDPQVETIPKFFIF